jgi:hypothetical protein
MATSSAERVRRDLEQLADSLSEAAKVFGDLRRGALAPPLSQISARLRTLRAEARERNIRLSTGLDGSPVLPFAREALRSVGFALRDMADALETAGASDSWEKLELVSPGTAEAIRASELAALDACAGARELAATNPGAAARHARSCAELIRRGHEVVARELSFIFLDVESLPVLIRRKEALDRVTAVLAATREAAGQVLALAGAQVQSA